MKSISKTLAAAAVALLGGAAAVHAAPTNTLLTFEGVGDLNEVGNFYGNQGIIFANDANYDALAAVDSIDGGSGNWTGEPSENTAITNTTAFGGVKMTSLSGFTSFSFYYSAYEPGTVQLYDQNGNPIAGASANITPNVPDDGTNTYFDQWDQITIPLGGATAYSAVWVDTNGLNLVLDDVDIDLNPYVSSPEPFSIALLGVGLVGLGAARRWRR